jgi:hypothetical protein
VTDPDVVQVRQDGREGRPDAGNHLHGRVTARRKVSGRDVSQHHTIRRFAFHAYELHHARMSDDTQDGGLLAERFSLGRGSGPFGHDAPAQVVKNLHRQLK